MLLRFYNVHINIASELTLTSCGSHLLQGVGIEDTLEAIVQQIPAPEYSMGKPLRALIFDSAYDSYKVCNYDSLLCFPMAPADRPQLTGADMLLSAP